MFCVDNVNDVRISLQLGYVDINLAEFAGAGATCRNYLLQSYNEKKRKPDNSIVKVKVNYLYSSFDAIMYVNTFNKQWTTKGFFIVLVEVGQGSTN